jgi:hypothetical protein
MFNRIIYYTTKNDPGCVNISGPYEEDSPLYETTLAIRRKQFEKGAITYLCATVLEIVNGVTNLYVAEEHHKTPVETLELNVAAKKKTATAKLVKKPITINPDLPIPAEPQW